MTVSVVIPMYNELENLKELTERLQKVLDGTKCSWEVVFVDDGSHDGSWDYVERLHRNDPRFQGIQLTRNFGQQAALTAGFALAKGDAVVPMDADLQDPPELIPQMLDKWREGYQVVNAVRHRRRDKWHRRLTAGLFYRILNRISNIRITLDSGDFCLMDRAVVDALNRLPERNRFIRGLRSWVGFRQTAIEFDRKARIRGKTKYSYGSLIKLALDGIIAFSGKPLRFMVYLGIVIALIAIIGAIWFAYRWILGGGGISGYAVGAVLILFLGGIQLICLGIVGEYIQRIYHEVKGRPEYIIRKTLPGNPPET